MERRSSGGANCIARLSLSWGGGGGGGARRPGRAPPPAPPPPRPPPRGPRTERRPGPVTVAVGESKPGLTAAEKRASDRATTKKKKPSTRAGYRTHRVRSGQTLSSIAHTYKVSIRDLRQANDLGASSAIRVGEKLKVPVAR